MEGTSVCSSQTAEKIHFRQRTPPAIQPLQRFPRPPQRCLKSLPSFLSCAPTSPISRRGSHEAHEQMFGVRMRSKPNDTLIASEPKVEDTPASQSTIPLLGVRLGHLLQLDVDRSLTVTQVCDMVIKPATSEAKCSYVDMLQARPDLCQEVAMSTVFVSYAWKYPFMQVLETVARAFPPETTFLWFDVVTVNQHTSSTVTLPMWLATFGTALSSIGEVVFVFKNWRRPVNTTRSWCVFEMVVTARIGVKSQVLFLPGEEGDFSAAMLANELSLGDFLTIFGSVNVEKAEAFKEEDRLEILTQLHTEGTQRVNDLAMLPLKQWMLKEASRVCELASKEGGGNTRPMPR
jgi:hypothetical protein